MTIRLDVRDLKIWQHRPRMVKSGNTAYRPNSARVFGALGRARSEGFYIVMRARRERV